jgi:hypothetical protein
VRKVNLSFDFIAVTADCTLRLARARGFPRFAEVSPHFVGFVIFERTGMGLLLGDPNLGQ